MTIIPIERSGLPQCTPSNATVRSAAITTIMLIGINEQKSPSIKAMGNFAIFFMYADDGTRDVRYVSSKPGEGGYFIPDEEILINSIDVKRD